MLYTGESKASNAGSLLSEPSENPASFTRSSANYEDHSSKFELKEKNFQRQYAHIYAERLQSTRKYVEEAAKKKWGDEYPVKKLFELVTAEKCIVIGTLFKHMELKPNILKEISEEHALITPPSKERYFDDTDELILEDELQRIVLRGNVDVHQYVTGVIIGLMGVEPEDDRGKFHVEEVCFQPLEKQEPMPSIDEDRYVAFISGLEAGAKTENQLANQLMIDLLTGQLGDEEQQKATSNIVRLVLCGNSLSSATQDKDSMTKAKYLTKKTAAGSIEAIKSLDESLIQLSACMEVDIMPGEYDPANFTLPQQPLHKCMFPQASMYPTLRCVTNPYECSVDGIRFLGSSGQPINDIYKFSKMEDRLDMLERTLVWGHLAPTAPDTLGCYPYYSEDPFMLRDCPHVYFAANQPMFQTKLFKGEKGQEVRLVCVPRFSQTQTCVLVNLRTLECQPICFNTEQPMEAEESPEVDK